MNNRISDIVWQQADLTAMETAYLRQLTPLLPFVADLAQSVVRLYVPHREKEKYLILRAELPHTIYFSLAIEPGAKVAAAEEPLIGYTFCNSRSIHGGRETAGGEPNLLMTTYPVIYRDKVIAVASLETTREIYESDGYEHILRTARLLLGEVRNKYGAELFRSIGENDGIFITDKTERIILASLSAERIYRVLGVSNPVGRLLTDRIFTRHITRETVDPNHPYEKEITAGGLVLVLRNIPIEEAGQRKGRIVVIEDVTAIREKEREIKVQRAVIREIHHRVKNNLQSIASLLNLQARRTASPEAREAIKESAGRVRSIATIHEYLSNQGTDVVDAKALIQNLLNNVENMLPPSFVLIRRFSGGTFKLAPQTTTSFALAINELLLNIIRHAFSPERERGIIGSNIEERADGYHIEFYDDGRGLPDGFDPAATRSLGMTLIRNFIEDDLGGRFSLGKNPAGKGTCARIILPLTRAAEEGNDIDE